MVSLWLLVAFTKISSSEDEAALGSDGRLTTSGLDGYALLWQA